MTEKKGATLGKMAVGLTVTSVSGEKLSLGNIILRETIGKLISELILCIGFLMAAFTEKKQALHDKMVKSVVIYKDPQAKKNTAVIIVVTIVVIFVTLAIVGILSSIVLASLNTAREKANESYQRSVNSSLQSTTTVSDTK